MNRTAPFALLGTAVCLATLGACATSRNPASQRVVWGESVVCVGEEPARLAWLPDAHQPLRLRSSYLPSTDTVDYLEGRDFIVDYEQGTLRRTSESRVPDFGTNVLFGKHDFDHSAFPGFGNTAFFTFADYATSSSTGWPLQPPQAAYLERTRARLAAGEAVTIVAYGDSITAGGDATTPALIFWNRWADELKHKYPSATIAIHNGATGGDSTVQGLARLQEKVLDQQPHLVLIGFGMNDHNRGGVPVPQFERNLQEMIARIRETTRAEVILFSAFPPNPNWKFGSQHMADYAAATERTARAVACAYADVFGNWSALAARKKPEDLLGNNINHPNDFGHWIYYRVLSGIGL
jgi:lysophospholipase L1-like esterase